MEGGSLLWVVTSRMNRRGSRPDLWGTRGEIPRVYPAGLAKRKGEITLVARRGLKEAWSKGAELMNKKPDRRRLRWRASGHMTAKPISIKLTGGKSGGCASKAVELPLSGDLRYATES